jgi:hypothetical protein
MHICLGACIALLYMRFAHAGHGQQRTQKKQTAQTHRRARMPRTWHKHTADLYSERVQAHASNPPSSLKSEFSVSISLADNPQHTSAIIRPPTRTLGFQTLHSGAVVRAAGHHSRSFAALPSSLLPPFLPLVLKLTVALRRPNQVPGHRGRAVKAVDC